MSFWFFTDKIRLSKVHMQESNIFCLFLFCFTLSKPGRLYQEEAQERKKEKKKREKGGRWGAQDELIIHRYKSQPGLIPACEVTSAPQREHKKLVVLFGFPPAMMAAWDKPKKRNSPRALIMLTTKNKSKTALCGFNQGEEIVNVLEDGLPWTCRSHGKWPIR